MSLFNVDLEAECLSILLQHPDSYADFHLINEMDFTPKLRAPVYAAISQQLNQVPAGSVSPVVLADKLRSYGITSIEGVEPYIYLDALKLKTVSRGDAEALAKELKRWTVRRQLVSKCEETKARLVNGKDMSFEEMGRTVELGLTSIATEYHRAEVEDPFANMIEVIEARADKPLKADEVGYLGPFQSINETIASLTYRGSYTVVGSRSGGGKSSLGWFYNTYLLERYPDLHLLHLDSAEMTVEELQWRALCCMSEGRIPYWAAFRGVWRDNPEWRALVENDLWPRVRKLKGRMGYKNIGSMSPKERLSFLRRYYYNKVGRGNHLLIHDDYLKGVEAMGEHTQEHQTLGYYVGGQKSLITDEIIASVWTSVQNNRSGIVRGKKVEDIVDSEAAFSLSDRIYQQSTHSFILRYKLAEELALEGNAFGNLRLTPTDKKRQLLGERYMDMLKPIKMPNGQFVPNHFNLDTKGFWYRDCGDLKSMLPKLGQSALKMGKRTGPDSPI